MSSSPTLQTTAYTPGTARAVRRAGRVPAVVYGRKKPVQHISVDANDFLKAYRIVHGATLLELEIDGKTVPALVQEATRHPTEERFVHIDFHAVDPDTPVHASIPLRFSGQSPAVKLLGGVLTTQRTEVEVKCLPKYLLSFVEVSLEKLEHFHDVITLADLPFGPDVQVLGDPQAIIASVSAPRVSDDDEPATEEENGAEKEGGSEAEAEKTEQA